MSAYQSNLIVYPILVVSFIVLHLAAAPYDPEERKHDDSRYHCGKELSSKLSILCDGYNEDDFLGKTIAEVETGVRDESVEYDENDVYRNNIIVDECCRNKCSNAVLKSYCTATKSPKKTGETTTPSI